MSNIFMMNEEIARGMVCFFHQKKHSYLIEFFKPKKPEPKVWSLSPTQAQKNKVRPTST
jgi:hypothetical protein